MNTSNNNYDSIEQVIYSENIRIKSVDFHTDLDLMLILLNTGAVLREQISKYPRLKHANEGSLVNYQLLGKGTGIHWPELDEDLSLKIFLRNLLVSNVIYNKVA